jgi:hypothetical protein
MTKEEIIEFLKKELEIRVKEQHKIYYEGDHPSYEISLILCGEEIDSDYIG